MNALAIMRSPKYADSDCREKQRLGLGLGARGDLGRPSQRLRVDVPYPSGQLHLLPTIGL